MAPSKQKGSISGLVCLLVLCTSQLASSHGHNYDTMAHYDPELSADGIPVLNSHGDLVGPSTGYDLDVRASGPQRRQSDFDDEAEDDSDDERDEYKAGSANHDSYENPSFGESRGAAKDGEDIEHFFDKHIGPSDSDQVAAGSANVEDDGTDAQLQAAPTSDPDDYDAAASSPLSTIFHSLLNHAHKNKIIITTTDDSPAPPAADQTSGSHALGLASPVSPMGSSSKETPYVEATPIAYLTSSANQHETTGVQDNQEEDPVRKIYISRRPIVSQYQQPSHSPTSGAAPNWRSLYPAAARQVYYQQQPQRQYVDYASGTALPMAASYSYNNRDQPMSPPEEEEQTVSYGLSFGGSVDENEGTGAAVAAEPAAADEGQEAEGGQSTGYDPYAMRNNMRHSSSMRYYQNYNQAPTRAQSYGDQQVQYPHQGSMYHRDPSESSNRAATGPGAGYNQYSKGSNSMAAHTRAASNRLERQRLLANLDRQIKSSTQYRQLATVPIYTHTENKGSKQAREEQKEPQNTDSAASPPGNDYDTYSSYHQEMDPYRSLTTVSRSVSEPVVVQHRRNNTGGQQFEANGNSTGNHQSGILSGPVGHFINGDLLRSKLINETDPSSGARVNLRVRRDDSEDRDDDDDGVWVDDDEDDADSRQQSSNVNETSQEPAEEEVTAQDDGNQQTYGSQLPNPTGVIGGPHGYELSPNDLMIYHGRR